MLLNSLEFLEKMEGLLKLDDGTLSAKMVKPYLPRW
jgi:hypothetical protein